MQFSTKVLTLVTIGGLSPTNAVKQDRKTSVSSCDVLIAAAMAEKISNKLEFQDYSCPLNEVVRTSKQDQRQSTAALLQLLTGPAKWKFCWCGVVVNYCTEYPRRMCA